MGLRRLEEREEGREGELKSTLDEADERKVLDSRFSSSLALHFPFRSTGAT